LIKSFNTLGANPFILDENRNHPGRNSQFLVASLDFHSVLCPSAAGHGCWEKIAAIFYEFLERLGLNYVMLIYSKSREAIGMNLAQKTFIMISVLIFFAWSAIALSAPAPLIIHFIKVGDADSILVQSPGGRNMLIDAGKESDSHRVTSYLTKHGVKSLDLLVATHPHLDHIGGMAVVVEQFKIGRIFMPKVLTTTRTFEHLMTSIKQKGLKVNLPTPGSTLALDPALQIMVLAPNSPHYKDLNNYSIVLKITYNKTSFLLVGDAEKLSEKEMLLKHYDLRSDLLKAGHHGSNSSTSTPFLRAVRPKYAVISAGKNNRERDHPNPKTLARLKKFGVKLYRTELNGTITVYSDGKTIQISTRK
jgi:competence protein ComEC